MYKGHLNFTQTLFLTYTVTKVVAFFSQCTTTPPPPLVKVSDVGGGEGGGGASSDTKFGVAKTAPEDPRRVKNTFPSYPAF
jgi:hypothetical protein